MKAFLQKYKHAWILSYFLVYLAAFFYLENRHVNQYTIIQSSLDSYIPFMEIFIVPYFLWFAFVAVWVVYFLFTNKTDYYKFMSFLFVGMTIFIIWSWLFPNQLRLRPTTFARDNLFVTLVQFLYRIDTPTNVFPSIHVYNSLAVAIAVLDSKALKQRKGIRIGTVVMATVIVLSTMFLKQHSLEDVTGAFLMAGFFYWLIYMEAWKRIAEKFTGVLSIKGRMVQKHRLKD